MTVDISLNGPIDWTTKELNKPYYDRSLQKWCVPIETAFTSGGVDLQGRLSLYLKPGLEIILRENGKKHDEEYLNLVLTKSRFDDAVEVSAEEYYIDPRRGGTMRVLICFMGIDETEDISREEAYLETAELDKIQLTFGNHKARITRLANIFDEYAEKVDNFNGTVESIDFRLEAENLRKLIEDLKFIISDNSISPTNDTIIEIALDSNREAAAISENSTGQYRRIFKGVSTALDDAPFDSQRTMNYLSMMEDIIEGAANRLTWTEVIENYTIPFVRIFPSKIPSEKLIAAANKKELTAEKLDKAVQKSWREFGVGVGTCEDKGAIESLKDFAKNFNSAKTKKEKDKEEALYKRFAKDVKDEALRQVDFVGDSLYIDLGLKVAKMKTLDEVYEKVLNKICLTDLAIPALACFQVPTLSEEAKRFKERLPDLKFCPEPGNPCSLGLPPTVKIKDDLPTKDLLADFSDMIYDALIDMLTQMFVEIVKDIVGTLHSICAGEDDEQEGGGKKANISNLFEPPPDGMGDLLDDLSNLLSARELCLLLQGRASSKTISLVRTVIQKLHPQMAKRFRTKSSIVNYFRGLGNLADSSFCEDLADFPSSPSITCDDPFAPNEVLYTALSEKEEITEDQINEQLAKARERRKNKLDKVTTIMDMIAAGQRGDVNAFERLMPALLTGPGGKGLIDLNHHTYKFMQGAVIDNMLSGVYTSFNKNSNKLKDSLVEEITEVQEESLKVTVEHNGQEFRFNNPEVKAMVNKGVSLEEMGLTEEDLRNPASTKTFMSEKKLNVTNRNLKTLLSNLESSETFIQGADGEGFYYELTVPSNLNVLDAIEALGSFNIPEIEQLQERIASAPSWKIRYKVPYMTDTGADAMIDDDYIIEVFPSDSTRFEGLRKVGRGDIDQKVLDFINFELIDSGETNIDIPLDDVDLEETEFAVQPLAEEQVEEELCPTPEELPPPPEKITPPPQSVFGRYVHHLWDQDFRPILDGMDYSESYLSQFTTRVEKYFAQTLYPQASRDLLSLIAKQASESSLLVDELKTVTTIGNHVSSISTPTVSKFNLSRSPTELEKACNVDPHLLKIENYKSEISLNISQMDQEELLNAVNSDDQDPWSSAVLRSIVKLTVRSYCFDYALRSMYMVTEFAMEDSVDDYIKEYLMNMMTSEMKKYNPEYPVVLSTIADDIYASMIGEEEVEEGKGLLEIIGQSLEEVYADLKCVFKQENFMTASKSVKDKLIQEWLPMIDLPGEGKNRFIDIGPSITSIEDELRKYLIELPEKRKALADALSAYAGVDAEIAAHREDIEQEYPGQTFEELVEERKRRNNNIIGLRGRVATAEEHKQNIACWWATSINPAARALWEVNKNQELDDVIVLNGYNNQAEVTLGPGRTRANLCWHLNNFIDQMKAKEDENIKWIKEFDPFEKKLSDLQQDLEEAQNVLDTAQAAIDSVITSDGEVMDIANNVNISREDLDQLASGTVTSDSAKGIDIAQRLGTLSSITQNGESVSFDLSNGNFFLERSIRVKRRTDDQIKKHLLDNADASNDLRIRLVTAFNEAWEAYSPLAGEDLRATFSADRFSEFITGFSFTLGRNMTEDQLSQHPEDHVIWTAENFLEEFSPELRLMYLPPVNQGQFEESRIAGTDSDKNEIERAMFRMRNGDPQLDIAVKKLGSITKAYFATETETREVFNVGSEEITSETVDRDVYPIPLIDTGRMEDDRCEYSGWLKASLGILMDDNPAFMRQYNSSIRELKDKLLESMEFKLLFDFVFPIDRYLSMITVYSMLSTSTVDGVSSSFNPTKDQLYFLFNMLNMADYRQQGPSNAEVQKLAEEFSKPDACFSFDDFPTTPSKLLDGTFKSKFKTKWSKEDNPFHGVGLEWVLDSAKETGKIIFKNLTETVDPNIKMAKEIQSIFRGFGFCEDLDIPLPLISFALLPPMLPFPPASLPINPLMPFLPPIGNGPILTPMGIAYLAYGPNWQQYLHNRYFSKKTKEELGKEDCSDIETCGPLPTDISKK